MGDFRAGPGLNNLSGCRDTVVSNDDNRDVCSQYDNPFLKRKEDNTDFAAQTRSELEKVRSEIEETLSDRNRNTVYSKRDQTKPVKYLSNDHDQTAVKEAYVDNEGTDPVSTYAKHVQIGSYNMMLVCEPKERQKVQYKQVGDKNVMVNLTHSSNFYQLLMEARERGKHAIFPLTADGELWVDIIRRSQVFKSRGSSASTTLSVLSNEDNTFYPMSKPRDGMQHEELFARRSGVEHDDCKEPLVLRRGEEFDEDVYSAIDIEERSDRLQMKFEVRRSGKGFDKSHIRESILSHRKVQEFLMDEKNDFFQMEIYDWEYQRDSTYDNILNDEQLYGRIENGYSAVPKPPPIGENGMSVPMCEEDVQYAVVQRPGRVPIEHSIESLPPVPPRRTLSTENSETKGCTSSPTKSSCPTLTLPSNNSRNQKNNLPLPPRSPVSGSARCLGQKSDDFTGVQQAPALPPRSPQPKHRKVPSAVPDTPEPPLSTHKWYQGKIDSSKAKEILKDKPNGSFLVRDANNDTMHSNSSNRIHAYTIEFVDDCSRCKKLKIMQTDKKYHFVDSEHTKFERLSALIETIINNGLEIQADPPGNWKNIKVYPI